MNLLLIGLKKNKDGIVAALLFLSYHWYDGICYVVSNEYDYLKALTIMLVFLFVLSVLLVFIHEIVYKRFSWDILGLKQLNELKNIDNLPKHKIFKRFIGWVLYKGYWAIYLIGPGTVGPFIVAILLRKEEKWRENMIYIIPGTLMSTIIWVSVWTGVGAFTWKQYVIPLYNNIFWK